MKKQSLWIGIAIVALSALLVFWWYGTHEKRWYTYEVPLEGEASYNDYFVVQQALRGKGVNVQSLPHLPAGIEHWGSRDGLLLGSDLQTLGPGQVNALLDWVGRGGRLLIATGERPDEERIPLLDRIGIVASGNHRECFEWKNVVAKLDPPCLRTFALEPSQRDRFDVVVGRQQDRWVLARRALGHGEIEVVGDFAHLRNRSMDSPQNADWAWQLLGPLQQGGVFRIVYQTELPPLYAYLIRYGWFALLPLLVALLGWLWTRSQRFGPLLPLPAPDRRALGEHIQASGEYLFRRGLVAALYAPLRRRFDDHLRRRDPELAALPQANIAQVLAERHRLPIGTVQQALRTPLPNERKTFLSTVQTLLKLMRTP